MMSKEEKREFEEAKKTAGEKPEEAEESPKESAEEPEKAADEQAKEAAEDSASEKVEDAQEKAEKLVAELSSQLLRLQADFQNYKRRTQEDRASDIEFANKKLATALLDVIDNFERALGAESSDKQFKEGMELILIKVSMGQGAQESVNVLSPLDQLFGQLAQRRRSDTDKLLLLHCRY